MFTIKRVAVSVFSKTSADIGARLRRALSKNQKQRLKRLISGRSYRAALAGLSRIYKSDLATLAVAFGSDKAGCHHYTEHYERHFGPLRRKKLNLLEIGIGGYGEPKLGGASLRMWKAYFPNSRIFGIDIHDKSFHDEARIKTFKGSQANGEFLRNVAKEIGGIDIIIDDGSHYNAHVIATFNVLFPLLNENGIYAIEDLQTSYWEKNGAEKWDGSSDLAASHTSMNYLKRLVDGLNYEEFAAGHYQPTYFDRYIVSMHFYHNLAFIHKGWNSEGSNKLGKKSPLNRA